MPCPVLPRAPSSGCDRRPLWNGMGKIQGKLCVKFARLLPQWLATLSSHILVCGAAARRARASGYEPRKPVRREGAMRRSPSQTRANGLTGPSTTSFRAAVHLSAFAMSVRRYFLCSSSIDREPDICASTLPIWIGNDRSDRSAAAVL